MRLVLQRVSEAYVIVHSTAVGAIRTGVVALLGITRTDTASDADYLLDKLLGLRIFPDSEGKMNLNVQQAGGALLIVSQFTLYADCRKGRRPSFDAAAPAEQARTLYESFVEIARRSGLRVETGVFQAHMEVALVNDGPVTLMLETGEGKLP